MVKVYRFQLYNISTDQNETSRRWGTREAIERIGGEVMKDTETEVNESDLIYDGMTDRDFNPHKLTGFQTQVLP
jgi:hypothetical protein